MSYDQGDVFGTGASMDEASPPPLEYARPAVESDSTGEVEEEAPKPKPSETGSDPVDERLYGLDLFGNAAKPESDEATSGPIFREFLFPPFSVFDAKQGYWQERKRAWIALGIRSEVGRDEGLTFAKDSSASLGEKDTSIFDPVLCELLVRWFSASGDLVLDPFAGGSVRGVVSGCLGRAYRGIDLRAEQVEENRTQAEAINPTVRPEWVVGDALDALRREDAADFLLTCPPYGDLERYSDDPKDLSTQDWPDFRENYRAAVALSYDALVDDRFAAVVVGDFRDRRTGMYRNFVGETVAAFSDAGFGLYNEAILVGSIASASMRVGRQFRAGRKFAKTHQNVLVFVKGDWRIAADRLGGVAVEG